MSADSVFQWEQMLSGQYCDIHPAAHTLTIWLVTRVWLSPAAYALVQIGALAFTFALAMRELALAGISRRAQMALTALFALSPVNNVMVITLCQEEPMDATWMKQTCASSSTPVPGSHFPTSLSATLHPPFALC